jgi:predicted O-methyltransferase YrrM
MNVLSHYLLWNIGLAEAETQTTEAERDCLARHAAGRGRLVEIGVWHGVTTCRLRRAMAADGVLYAVDPYPVGRLRFSIQQRIARRHVGRETNGRVEWLRMTGAEAGRQYDLLGGGPPDFIFIDGDHTYEGLRADWEAWNPRVLPGGVIALHDSRPTEGRPIHDAGSVRYTRGVIAHDPHYELVEAVETVSVFRRRENP